MELKLLILLICSPFLIIFMQAIFLRIFRSASSQVVTILCGITVNVPLIVIIWRISFQHFYSAPISFFSAVFYGILVYNLLFYVYFHLFNMSETARRIRILYEIYKWGAVSDTDIKGIYKTDEMISVRLDNRLISLRQIVYKNNKYLLNRKLLYRIAKILEIWRRLLGYSGENKCHEN